MPLDTASREIEPRQDTHRQNTDVTVLALPMHDPRVRPLLDQLAVEYESRYAELFGPGSAVKELNKYPAHEFAAPFGALIILEEHGQSVAGGAFRLHSEGTSEGTAGVKTAEFKRIWTHLDHRRRGLARRVLVELEAAAAALGYTEVYLTTGPRQPEARALYLNTGYQPLFDVDADPATLPFLAFTKPLPQL